MLVSHLVESITVAEVLYVDLVLCKCFHLILPKFGRRAV